MKLRCSSLFKDHLLLSIIIIGGREEGARLDGLKYVVPCLGVCAHCLVGTIRAVSNLKHNMVFVFKQCVQY